MTRFEFPERAENHLICLRNDPINFEQAPEFCDVLLNNCAFNGGLLNQLEEFLSVFSGDT
jgi:hypothetical protein